MALPNYPLERRRDMAAKLNIDEQYLYQLLRGLREPAPALARRLSQIDNEARLWDLRPKDWHFIWPELIGSEGAPKVVEPATAGG